MTNHQLAAKLLEQPLAELVVQTGEDSRDNSSFAIASECKMVPVKDIEALDFLGLNKRASVSVIIARD